MDINTFLSIGIIGIALSSAFQILKQYLPTSSAGNKLIMVGLSLLVGGLYFFFSNTTWWVDILGVLASASTVYAFFFSQGTSSPSASSSPK